ncbi:Spy/CpxP family protein refolding chaperone [Maribellus maritimus]|uniref:Spy/CpxP family protein refolding chaperone n=1 Tax=Maribellus maritimus TaxID=2870838 RepID=UPI001EECE8D9|nr:Spy/CpxP family protein refolding chaperone [Maribellus maritimus]MCG6190921.1 Spy/CpxP family protein refolding chaperone [Maribellus maritimus]
MKTKVLGLFMTVAMIVATNVSAQNPQQKNDFRRWDKERIDRDINPRGKHQSFFTDEQKETLKEMRLEIGKQVKPLRNELGELEARQQTLSTVEKPDMNAIYKNIEKISDIKTEIAKIMAKHNQEIRGMLTEEQLMKYDKMKKRQQNYHHDFDKRNGMDRMDRQRFEKS